MTQRTLCLKLLSQILIQIQVLKAYLEYVDGQRVEMGTRAHRGDGVRGKCDRGEVAALRDNR